MKAIQYFVCCLIVFMSMIFWFMPGPAFAQRLAPFDSVLKDNTNDFVLENKDLVVKDRGGKVRLRFDIQSGGDFIQFGEDGTSQTLRLNSGGQIISRHRTSVGKDGLDSASNYVESRDPAIALRDTTNGNQKGWLLQTSSTGALSFRSGDLAKPDKKAFVLNADGSVCIGTCD